MDAGRAGVRRIVVRRSPVHGRGVFALRPLAAEERVIEYRGEIISWDEARARDEAAAGDATYFFDLGDGLVIDGARGGNSARFLNHACHPNCEALDLGGRIVIHALRAITVGEELTLDYGLVVGPEEDEQDAADEATAENQATEDNQATEEGDDAVWGPDDPAAERYRCRCGAPTCRGSMLAG